VKWDGPSASDGGAIGVYALVPGATRLVVLDPQNTTLHGGSYDRAQHGGLPVQLPLAREIRLLRDHCHCAGQKDDGSDEGVARHHWPSSDGHLKPDHLIETAKAAIST
jgi:hypothetical protein